MKTKLILVLTVIIFTFQSCSSNDDINDPIIAELECQSPINLSISEITADSAVLNWDIKNDNIDFEIEYGLLGFLPGTGTFLSTSQNSISIDGLAPSTSYDFYVQAICTADNMSPQSKVASFTTTEISRYAGTWSGTYAGGDTGTWTFDMSVNGIFINGSSYSNNANQTISITSVTITSDNYSISTLENGSSTYSQIIGDTVNGTWVNTSQGISGTLSGSRE